MSDVGLVFILLPYTFVGHCVIPIPTFVGGLYRSDLYRFEQIYNQKILKMSSFVSFLQKKLSDWTVLIFLNIQFSTFYNLGGLVILTK